MFLRNSRTREDELASAALESGVEIAVMGFIDLGMIITYVDIHKRFNFYINLIKIFFPCSFKRLNNLHSWFPLFNNVYTEIF